MSENIENNPATTPAAEPKPRKPLWKKILKITGFTLLGVVLLILAALTLMVWILTPERLTPIVERTANENLNADVTVGRVELTFWSTFPHLEVEVNDLKVNSRLRSQLPDSVAATLPAWADSLASVGRFHGSINVAELMIGRIDLSDITIDRPRFNLVQAYGATNYDIVPPSEETPEPEPSGLPDFSFGKFEIMGGLPVRYLSLPDSTDLTLRLEAMSFAGNEKPVYRLSVSGNSRARVADIEVSDLRLGLDGSIKWDHNRPLAVDFDGFEAGVGPVILTTDASVDMTDLPTVNRLKINLRPVALDSLMAVVPQAILRNLDPIEGDITIGAEAELTKPYVFGAIPMIPSAKLHLTIGEGRFAYDRLQLKKLSLDATAEVDGANPDKSVLTVGNLLAIGEGVGFRLDGKVTDPLSDPHVVGTFKGGIVTRWLPKRLLNRLPFDITGDLHADCTFDLRKSYLNRSNFHRIRFTGDASLKDFALTMHDASAEIDITEAALKLGTNSTIHVGTHRADSLLTASLEIDSLTFFTPGLRVTGKDWKMGLGTLNAATSATDTTVINPIGARIQAEYLNFMSEQDSMKVRLRDAQVSGSLTRFHGDRRKPQLRLKIQSRRAVYSDSRMRAFLSEATTSLTLHPAPPRIGKRTRAIMDSIHAAEPQLAMDSVFRLARAIRTEQRRAADPSYDPSAPVEGTNAFDLDNSTVALLKKWNVKGDMKAKRISVFTPMFPIRNSIRDLDIAFSSDSVRVTDTHYRIGRSEFVINGTVSNISRSLTSRRGSPLMINFNISGDTIDVNRIAAAAFAGAAFAERAAKDSSAVIAGGEMSEAAMQSVVDDVASTDTVTAIIIPMNIEADLSLKFNHVLYSDLLLHDLRGNMLVYGGAMNLRNLRASTDIGSISLNALYSAPDRTDLKFAFGMDLSDFRIAKFIQLMPSIDSIMPLLSDISGIINAEVAATSELTPNLDINIPTLSAAIKLTGDSLVLLDNETFRTVSKWLMFKNKKRNMIDRMTVEMIVENSQLELFPFMFDIDRYRLGVMGHNDLAMNFNYHVAVIKSPLPFKFGINISGNPDKMKIRLGGAKLNEKNVGQRVQIADTTRINLVRQIESSFKRGIRNSDIGRLRFNKASAEKLLREEAAQQLSASDSALFIKEGLIEAPAPAPVDSVASTPKKSKKK